MKDTIKAPESKRVKVTVEYDGQYQTWEYDQVTVTETRAVTDYKASRHLTIEATDSLE